MYTEQYMGGAIAIAKNLSNLADWKIFINNYIDAHNMALKK